MSDRTKQFAKTLIVPIRAHVKEHGFGIARSDVLIAYDAHSGRVVITFEVEQTLESLPVKAAEVKANVAVKV
jgi:hypothetical protein